MYELPYGNTQQLNLDWFIKRWQEFYTQWQETEAGIDHALDAEVQRVEDAMTDLYAARDAAAASATAAAGSASSASNDATIAANAATAAAASATLANTKATAAAISEANAAQSATAAANSAGAAATSASQASASEASATASAQSATASATAAGNSATAAATSETNAAGSETAAAASAQRAEDVLESIPADYSALSDAVDATPITWTNGAYIATNGAIGSVVDLTPTTNNSYRCAVVDCAEGDEFYIDGISGGSTPRAFAFVDSDTKLLEYRAVSSMNVLEPFILTAPTNAVKVIFNDHSSTLDGIIYKGIPPHYTYFALNKAIIDQSNTNASIMGGGSRIGFIQGSGHVNSTTGFFEYTYRSDRCSTDYTKPVILCNGDVIKCAEGLRYWIYRTTVTEQGTTVVALGGAKTGEYTIPADGTYYVLCEKVPAAPITPTEAINAFWIQHKGFRPDSLFVLERNPYSNVVWSAVRDITSVSHVHCTTQEQFAALKTHYDHVAISNYTPAIPYYPLDQHFTDIGTTLASPNAEHRHFSDLATSVHMNSLGSFLTSNDDYDGTSYDMIAATNGTLKQESGGGVTINHPKWSSLNKTQIESFINRGGILGIEIWNATSEQLNSTGDATELWDSVLADGVQCYGFAVPDHEVQHRPNEDRQPFGYNHMLVINKTPEEIMSAYRTGRFYTTLYNDGLTLEELTLASGTVSVEVSEASTITFKTASRTVTTESASTTATLTTQADDVYVRVEASRGTNKLYSNAIML